MSLLRWLVPLRNNLPAPKTGTGIFPFLTSVSRGELLWYFVGIHKHSTTHLKPSVFLGAVFAQLMTGFRGKSPTILPNERTIFPSPQFRSYQTYQDVRKNVEKLFLSRTEAILLRARVIMLKAVSPCNRLKDRAWGKTGGTGKGGLSAGT